MSSEFAFKFFRSPAEQRRALLASTSQAAIPMSSTLTRVINSLGDIQSSSASASKSRYSVLIDTLGSIRDLVIRCLMWRATSAIVIVCGVALSSRIIEGKDSLLVTAAFIGMFLCSKIFDAAIEYFDAQRRAEVNRVSQGFLMARVNAKLADIDRDALQKFSRGELKTLISSDVEAIEDFLTASLQQLVPALVSIIVLGPIIVLTAGTSGAVALGATICVAPVAIVTARIIERFQLRAQKEQDQLTTSLGEWLRNVRLVRFLSWERFFLNRFTHLMNRFTVWYALKHMLVCIVYGITFSWWMVPILAMLAHAHYSGISLSLVQLFSSVWILDHLVVQLAYINYPLSHYGPAIAGCERLQRLFSAPSISRHLQTNAEYAPTGRIQKIHLNSVTVAIEGKQYIGPISTTFDLTKRTAIVGEVGGGKSLLLELLVGERAPSTGTIEIEFLNASNKRDQIPLWTNHAYEHYRSQIAYVPQQAYLSNTLIKFNIDLSTAAPMDHIMTAATQSQLHQDIAAFRKGFDEEVGESGINLSGGQRQRVSMSRAFISGRPVFMLDDPLSAVDRDTEHLLAKEIFSDRVQGMVLVSHRLDELQRCDRIVVLSEGRIIEDGSPAQLASIPQGAFVSLVSAGEVGTHE